MVPLADGSQDILGFLQHYGWIALLVVMALEMGMIIHFLPTEVVLIAATLQLATTPLRLVLVIAVATLGSGVGAILPYAAGKYGGRKFLLRYPRLFRISPERLSRLELLFSRPVGKSLVLVLRVVPGFRTFPSIPAGVARMPFGLYLVLSTLGALLFNVLFCYASYASAHPGIPFSRPLGRARGFLHHVGQVTLTTLHDNPVATALIVAGLVVLLVIAVVKRHALWTQRARVARGAWLAMCAAVAGIGLAFLFGAIVAPHATFRAIEVLEVDFATWLTDAGFGQLATALILGSGIVSIAVLGFAVEPIVRTALRRARRIRHASLEHEDGQGTRGLQSEGSTQPQPPRDPPAPDDAAPPRPPA